MKIRKIPLMNIAQQKINYKLPISGKTIEIPTEHRNKLIATACISTVEAGAGMAFAAGGIATGNPAFVGVGVGILGKAAALIGMVKGYLWDFAGNTAKYAKSKANIDKMFEKHTKDVSKFEEYCKQQGLINK